MGRPGGSIGSGIWAENDLEFDPASKLRAIYRYLTKNLLLVLIEEDVADPQCLANPRNVVFIAKEERFDGG
jgi:hypothetical protein